MSINRNIVECKESFGFSEQQAYDVLIETLWNVKPTSVTITGGDTLRINRNIVECKDRRVALGIDLKKPVLIETLWNVKSYETLGVYSSMEY